MPVFLFPVELFQLRMPSEQAKGGCTFQTADDRRHRKLWRSRHQKMNMIVCSDLQMRYGKAFFRSDIVKHLFQLVFDISVKNFVPIFDSPYDMIVQIVHTSPTVCKFFIMPFHTNIIAHLNVSVVTVCTFFGAIHPGSEEPSFLAIPTKKASPADAGSA